MSVCVLTLLQSMGYGLKSPDATPDTTPKIKDISSWNLETTGSLGTSAGQTSFGHGNINKNLK